MQTDWAGTPRAPDRGSADLTGSPGSSQSRPTTTKRTLACERCFKRKQKCDRALPTCTACAQLGIECVVRSQQFDFTAEDLVLNHTTVHSYVESLRRRVAELEHDVQTFGPNHASATILPESSTMNDSATTPAANGMRSVIDDTPASSHRDGAGPAAGDEDSSVRDTMSAIGLLSNKAMAEPRAYSGDFPHKLAVSEVVSAALAVDGHNPFVAAASPPTFVMDDCPISLTRESTIRHIERFLDWAVFLPHIDENLFLEQYEGVVSQRGPAHSNADTPGLPRFNTYLAIATGIMMSAEANRLSALAANLHAAVIKLLPLIFRSQEPLDALHCMVLLVVFSMFSPIGGSTWHLMGVTMTTCIALGIHKESAPYARHGKDGVYRPEWIFWSIYLLDRSLASSMDRPFGINDGDISVSVPKELESDDGSSLSGAAKIKLACSRHLIVHAQLISDIRSNRRTDPSFSYTNICFWREFPPKIRSTSPTNSPALNWNQLACRALILALGSTSQATPANNSRDLSLHPGTSTDIELDVLGSCRRLIEQLYDRSGQGLVDGSFLDAYDLFSAAIAYICLLQRTQQGLAQTFEVVSKASVLLARYASRFTALDVFLRFLLDLSAKTVEGQGSLDQDYLRSIPACIPGHLRQLVECVLVSGAS